ncbi:hypothetical protein PROFUN_16484 [Planoprotostelium fungivorum]|uniref:Integrase catalytic domain-containing protein n=1 Tax=Planoprotostelium fungivorum TaxID=1890364 RepID=A0A2P6MPW4_9EUKA|nr:hypothetical protein PROFUN_16484 [Planoprotostelium fungivorum]
MLQSVLAAAFLGFYNSNLLTVMFPENSAEYNDGTNYLLKIIDVFSKYALAIPLQNKQGKTIARALDYIFRIKINNKAYKPMIVLSDNGKEFIAKEVKQLSIFQYTEHRGILMP